MLEPLKPYSADATAAIILASSEGLRCNVERSGNSLSKSSTSDFVRSPRRQERSTIPTVPEAFTPSFSAASRAAMSSVSSRHPGFAAANRRASISPRCKASERNTASHSAEARFGEVTR